MKKIFLNKGFTLIELLVVITIIGILATWATTVFTSQIQKARDSTRISDIKALIWWIEQVYQDQWEYPSKWISFTGVLKYVWFIPTDPKTSQANSNSAFDYLYNVGTDQNWVLLQEYEISTTFEQNGNMRGRALNESWNDNFRFEMWIDIDDIVNQAAETKPTSVGVLIPNVNVVWECINDTTAAVELCVSNSQHPMLVRW
jgi:prepilin-type N-terminal cleavage/methylation domain-containing protein